MMSQIWVSKIFKQMMLGCQLLLIGTATFAFSWQDLWVTKDKQAEDLMAKKQFRKAQTLFQDPAWQAAAAYRAENYEQAAIGFDALNTESGYYNQGNALAHMGKYEAAIKAYDKALAINPSNEDARFNRKLVEALLQKEKQKQQQNNQQSKDKKSNGEQSSQQDNNKESQQDKNEQSTGEQTKQNQGTANEQSEKQQDQNPQDKKEEHQDKKAEKDRKEQANKSNKNQGKENSQAENPATETESSGEAREKQQAKEQWLRLIPDDPGGLMREKFLRDYIRRQRGWDQ
jgi:Ca-activated chloride channel homolog